MLSQVIACLCAVRDTAAQEVSGILGCRLQKFGQGTALQVHIIIDEYEPLRSSRKLCSQSVIPTGGISGPDPPSGYLRMKSQVTEEFPYQVFSALTAGGNYDAAVVRKLVQDT
jgi:hypothetical protein